ncbi:MAG: SpoIIIAH-like family protein [Clostridia bacterium]
MKIKVKAKTKKILVLTVMVALLVTTGVLNFVLNDKLNTVTDQVGAGVNDNVTETFFAACRSDRNAVRESEFLCMDAIIKSEESSADAKKAAEQQKMLLVNRMEQENQLETLVKAKGFEDAIVTINDNGINVVVVTAEELTAQQMIQAMSIVADNTNVSKNNIKILPYNKI